MAVGYLDGESSQWPLWSIQLGPMPANTTGSSAVKAVGSPQLLWGLLRSLAAKANGASIEQATGDHNGTGNVADTDTSAFFGPCHLLTSHLSSSPTIPSVQLFSIFAPLCP